MNIQKQLLAGKKVRLEPLSRTHLPGLAAAIHDGKLWELPVTLVPHPSELESFLQDADTNFAAGRDLAFAIIDQASSTVVGSTRFCGINVVHKRLEIGFTFIAQSWQRTHINTECKYLLLSHAFDTWACNRVELLTDERNTKSRNAIARLGAIEEGMLRNHMIMRDGHLRTTVVFSIIGAQWVQVKAALEARLAAAS